MSERYKKLSLREQILLRPDTYIGAVTPEEITTYTWNGVDSVFKQETVQYSRGLMRLFEEIYENAMDQVVRSTGLTSQTSRDRTGTTRIDISFADGFITVKNNTGVENIPIQLNKEGVYYPQMIFCELLTSSNYNDNEKRLTAGRNGYGAKLTNIFSKTFIIDVVTNGKHYHQECRDHMSVIDAPTIKPTKEKNYTQISFLPDYDYFKIDPSAMLELFYKKCCDISVCLNSLNTRVKDAVSVYLNDVLVPVRKFEQYIGFYTAESRCNSSSVAEKPLLFIDPEQRISIGVVMSDSFMSIGFVNGVSCNSGSHVNSIVNSIVSTIRSIKKYSNVKPAAIKSCLNIFMVTTLENPTFTTQTKEVLVTPKPSYNIPDTFLNKITKLIKLSVTEQVAVQDTKTLKTLNKSVKRSVKIYDIPKLMDAEKAGTVESSKCKLFICEGDSAAGLGRILLSQTFKYNGLFPIRGRLLNVRNASAKQIAGNAEIQALLRILGLKIGEKATNMRYGGLVCLVDSDVFGIGAIQSLIMNFIHYWWPELLQQRFFYYFRTPIIKLTLKNSIKYCYSLQEYSKFIATNPAVKHTKYIKGLGTIEKSLGQEMSKNIPEYLIPFQPLQESENDLIDQTFNKDRSDDRKEWINATKNIQYDAEEEQSNRLANGLNITEYINKDVAEFSRYNLEISIPSIMDGFKPSQRKIMFTAFKKNVTNPEGIKVAQLGPMVAQLTAYKHGENNLMDTIINLAQDFTGSNNINFLKPIGQFGSRYNNTAASPRYIYTTLNPITRKIFRPEDDAILSYINDEGMSIEPEYYIPVIPTILVNGALGLGTGWSTKIPMWNVHDIIHYMQNVILHKPLNKINYYYKDFKGEIIPTKNGFISQGVYSVDNNKITITEIPLETSGESYKEFLHSLVLSGRLQDVVEKSTESISFVITVIDNKILADPIKELKLQKTILTTNMHLFDKNGLIKHYSSVYAIINEWMTNRFPLYAVRKRHMIKEVSEQLMITSSKYRFLQMIMQDELVVYRRKRDDVIVDLQAHDFKLVNGSYDYLLKLPITSFTEDMLVKLQQEIDELSDRLNTVRNTSIEQMWLNDLEDIERVV